MFLLHELEEGGHVGAAEVVNGLQPREHGRARETLEVVLADVLHKEHGFNDIKLQQKTICLSNLYRVIGTQATLNIGSKLNTQMQQF